MSGARPGRAPASSSSRSPQPRSAPPSRAPRPGGSWQDGRPDRGGARPRTREELAAREYDPRREERRRLTRLAVPDDVDPRDLDADVRAELRGLVKDTADLVARHLVVAGRLLDEDPERALQHARAAGALAGRVGSVREAVGLTAYAASEWADALSELRTARRITGRADHLAVIGDCERALGRPERAVALLDDPDVPGLDQAARVELVIVAAGARRDMGQPEAGVLLLQGPAKATTARRPWASRLWYAYADALLAAGREDEAREWFARAAEQDEQGETDAVDRLLELDGLVFEDLDEDGDEASADEPEDVDLQELLNAPLPSVEGRPAGDEGQPDGGQPDVGTSGDEHGRVGAAAEQVAPSVGRQDVSASEVAASEASQVHVVTPSEGAQAQPPAGRGPVAAAPGGVPGLFSHDEPPAPVAPRRAGIPVVSFSPPPDEHDADENDADEPGEHDRVAGPTGRGLSERDLGSGDVGTGDVGTGDLGTGDVGTGDLGSGDVGTGDVGTGDVSAEDLVERERDGGPAS